VEKKKLKHDQKLKNENVKSKQLKVEKNKHVKHVKAKKAPTRN